MTATNDWPGKPGVPLNPEKDGAHVLRFSSGKEWTCIWRASLIPFWVLNTGYRLAPSEIVSYRATYLGPCLTPDETAALQKRVAELEGALKDAAASVKEWGAYAIQYFQDKWDLSGEVARYIAIAEGKNDAAKEGKKDE